MISKELLTERVIEARASSESIRLSDLEEVAFGTNVALDPRVLINAVRASGDAAIGDALVAALSGAPAEAPKLIVELLCAADPIAPVPMVAARALQALLPAHPLATDAERIVAALHVFDAVCSDGIGSFAPSKVFAPMGEVIVADFDDPLVRWARGTAETDEEQRVRITFAHSAGLDIERRVMPPLLVVQLAPSTVAPDAENA